MSKRIIIFKEKHSDRYFDASTEEATLKAFYSILKERLKAGYWYQEPESLEKQLARYIKPEDAEYAKIPEEVLITLPEEIQKKARRIPTLTARVERQYAGEMEWWNNLNKVLSMPFTEAAKLTVTHVRTPHSLIKDLYESRADGEYEGYEFEELEDADVE